MNSPECRTIDLTDEESELFRTIEWFPTPTLDPETRLRNPQMVRELAESLIDRDAIPQIRRLYFTDSKYQTGGSKKSRKAVFESNGTSGLVILEHPHFLKYLRYFVVGPELPDGFIKSWTDKVRDLEICFSSSDVQELCVLARQLARKYRLDKSTAAREVHKLGLEFEVTRSYAGLFRKTVMQAGLSIR